MKILLAADIFPPQAGGPATYVVALANALTKRGHEVVVVSLNPESDSSKVKCRLSKVSFKSKSLKYLHYFWLLYKNAKKVDVIYAMGPVNAGYPASLVAKWRKKKFVVKVVGDYAWEQGVQRFGVNEDIDMFQTKEQHVPQVIKLQQTERDVVKAADAVIVPSRYLAAIVSGWGAGRIDVIYNSVKQPETSDVKKPGTEKWIVTVARLVPWKGVSNLVDMMVEIKKYISEARLIIIGDGPEKETLEHLAEKKDVADIIKFTGRLKKQEVAGYLKSSDVFVLNSAYEGLSHVILEALSFDVPVLASGIGGNPEVVQPGKNGELFGYGKTDEILKLVKAVLTGEKKYAWPESEKNEFMKKFSYDHMIDVTEKTLKDVCES